jgi:hypothetical protein
VYCFAIPFWCWVGLLLDLATAIKTKTMNNHLFASLLTLGLTSITIFPKSANAFFFSATGGDTYQIVELPVNDTPVTFLIDTGSKYTILDDDIASLLDLTETGTTIFLPDVSLTEPLESGSIVIVDSVQEVPIDFLVSDFPLSLGIGVTGILGADFFQSVSFTLDDVLLSINPDFPVTSENGRYLVTIPVKGVTGTVDVKYLIDTGSPRTIISTANRDAAGLLPLLDPTTGEPLTATLKGGTTGTSPVELGNLNKIVTIPFVINNVQGLPKGVSGLLGSDVLDKRFKLESDKLTITLPSPPNPPNSKEVTPVKFITTEKVPEPSSILSILALGTLGAASTLKRQLKSSKSSEKETTKVS